MDNLDGERRDIREEQKNLIRGSFYNFLLKYGTYFFSIFTSLIMSKIVTQELWGYLILAISYINIINLILSFLPPGLEPSLSFYIPNYIGQNRYGLLKSMIRNSFLIKLIFLIPLIIASLIIFQFFENIFSLNLNGYIHLLLILSPLIIIGAFNQILLGINRGFNLFKMIFYLFLVNSTIHIGGLLIIFLFYNTASIEVIAFIILIANLAPFILNIIIIIPKYHKLESIREEKLHIRDNLRKILNYGTPASISTTIVSFWDQIQLQAVGVFETSDIVTGFSIARNYSQNSINAITAFNEPLITSISKLHAQQNYNEINRIYNAITKYSNFLLLLLTGVLYFLTNFFLVIIYGEDYLIYSDIIKLMFFTLVFRVIVNIFDTYLYSTEKVKRLPILRIVYILIFAPSFFIGLIGFGIIGAIIATIIGNIVLFLIYAFYTLKYIKINMKKIALQYLSFFLAFTLALTLHSFIFRALFFSIFTNIGLVLLREMDIISIGIFIVAYLFMNVAFKIFLVKDIENLEQFFKRKSFINRIVNFFLRFLKTFIKN